MSVRIHNSSHWPPVCKDNRIGSLARRRWLLAVNCGISVLTDQSWAKLKSAAEAHRQVRASLSGPKTKLPLECTQTGRFVFEFRISKVTKIVPRPEARTNNHVYVLCNYDCVLACFGRQWTLRNCMPAICKYCKLRVGHWHSEILKFCRLNMTSG